MPDPANVLDYNRYGYARFNPLKYNDPTGHQTDDLIDDDERPAGSGAIVKGSVTGNANPLDADVADTAPSTSTRVNPAINPPGGLTPDAVITTSDYVRGKTENNIGNKGIQIASEIFQFVPKQISVDVNGEERVYDGVVYLGPDWDETMYMYVDVITDPYYAEVKTSFRSSRATISVSPQLRRQIELDAQMPTSPMWIFVGKEPSDGLKKLLDDASIVYHYLLPEDIEQQ